MDRRVRPTGVRHCGTGFAAWAEALTVVTFEAGSSPYYRRRIAKGNAGPSPPLLRPRRRPPAGHVVRSAGWTPTTELASVRPADGRIRPWKVGGAWLLDPRVRGLVAEARAHVHRVGACNGYSGRTSPRVGQIGVLRPGDDEMGPAGLGPKVPARKEKKEAHWVGKKIRGSPRPGWPRAAELTPYVRRGPVGARGGLRENRRHSRTGAPPPYRQRPGPAAVRRDHQNVCSNV